jgi:hypothetical protein
MRLRDLQVADSRPTKYVPGECAVCGTKVAGKGWFCSYACDTTERLSRVAHKLVLVLRDAAGVGS